MEPGIRIRACAKVNLFLDFTCRRPDGYHEINTVMQSVSLSDIISIFVIPEGIEISTDSTIIPNDRDNIVFKAAEAYFKAANKSCGIKIHIEKRIPVQAGMGGGSADAAAVIKGLNILTGINLPDNELLKIAASVGADVPFCLLGGCRRMTGIGEIPGNSYLPPDCRILIVKPHDGISTPAAYKELDTLYRDFSDTKGKTGSPPFCNDNTAFISARNDLYNIFEDVLPVLCPSALHIKQYLDRHSAGALLSGSGTAVFALFMSEEQAAENAKKMGVMHPDAFITLCNVEKQGLFIENIF